MPAFSKKSFARFFIVFCHRHYCLFLINIDKVGFKKNKILFLPTFAYSNGHSWFVFQPIWSILVIICFKVIQQKHLEDQEVENIVTTFVPYQI